MIRLLRGVMIRVGVWRINRRLDELEARFLNVSADLYNRKRRKAARP